MATVGEVAEFLKVKQATLYSWVNNGTIPAYKLSGLIRFDMDEVEEWIKLSRKEVSRTPNIGPRKTRTLRCRCYH